MNTNTLTVAQQYVDAVSANDFAKVGSLFAEDIVWHQPGDNRISGTYRGIAAVNEVLGLTMPLSQGTFELTVTGAPMVNGDRVALPVHFSARGDGTELSVDGVDVLRVEDDRIAEVWLFSAIRQDEDAFWDATWRGSST